MSQLYNTSKNSAYIFSSSIIVLGLNTITIFFLARYLGVEYFGIFSYALVLVGFVALFPDFGIQPILIRELARKPKQSSNILFNTIILKSLFCFSALIILLIYTKFLITEPAQKTAILILSLTIIVSTKTNALRVSFEAPYYARMEMFYPALFQIVDAVFQIILITSGIWLGLSFEMILWLFALANIPGLLLTIYFLKFRLLLFSRLDVDFIKWVLKESAPLFLYITLTMIYDRLDVLLLEKFWGKESVGWYSAAFRLTAPLAFIPYAITTSLYPMLSLRDSQNLNKDLLFSLGAKSLTAVGIFIAFLGTLFAPIAFPIFYGDDFSSAIQPFILLIWSQAIFFLIFFVVDYNTSQNRQKLNMIYIGCMLFLAFFVHWFMIAKLSLLGASLAKLILNLFGIILFLILSNSLSRNQKTTLIKAVFLFLSCLIFVVLHQLSAWFFAMIGLIIAAGLFVLWLLTPDEKRILQRLLKQVILRHKPSL